MDGSCMLGEIIEEILVRLPASSLIRFQQVCKPWRNMIQEPRFIEAQREHACKAYPPGKAVWSWGSNKNQLEFLDEALRPQKQKTWSMERSARIVGSCNGLVCIYKQSEATDLEIVIANPTIGEYLTLPTPSTRNSWEFSEFCFGYDPMTKQYKVTRFNFKNDIKEVYTLGDSSWRPINCRSLTNYGDLRGSLSVNGTIYLTCAYGTAADSQCIFSFDLKDETLMMLRLPSLKLHEGNKLLSGYQITGIDHMTIIDGSACLVAKSYCHSVLIELQLWTLESPQENRWSHRCNIGFYGVLPIEPIFIHGKKILVTRCGDTNMELCYHEVDLKRNDFIARDHVVKLEHMDSDEIWRRSVFDYIETLVPLNTTYAGSQRKKR